MISVAVESADGAPTTVRSGKPCRSSNLDGRGLAAADYWASRVVHDAALASATAVRMKCPATCKLVSPRHAPEPIAVHQTGPHLLVAATARFDHLRSECLGIGAHDFP